MKLHRVPVHLCALVHGSGLRVCDVTTLLWVAHSTHARVFISQHYICLQEFCLWNFYLCNFCPYNFLIVMISDVCRVLSSCNYRLVTNYDG